MHQNYSIYGLRVASQLTLADNVTSTFANCETFARAELTISEHPLVLSGITASNAQWQTDGHQLLGTIPLLGQTLIRSPHNITLYPEPGLCQEHLFTLALGSGLASSLCLSKWLPLHGTAISTPKGALLFLGASGSGKSTLALTAASAGWKVLTDDVISLHRANDRGPLLVYPSHPRFKADYNTAIALGFEPIRGFTTAPGVAKHPCYIPAASFSEQAQPVVAVYFLQQRQAAPAQRCIQLAPMPAVQALSNQCYRPGLIRLLKIRQQLFRQSISLSQQASFYQLWLPKFNEYRDLADYRQWFCDLLHSQWLRL